MGQGWNHIGHLENTGTALRQRQTYGMRRKSDQGIL